MRINWFCAIFCPHYSLCHENGFIWNHFCSCSHFHHERRDSSMERKRHHVPCWSSNSESSCTPQGGGAGKAHSPSREEFSVVTFVTLMWWKKTDEEHNPVSSYCHLHYVLPRGRECSRLAPENFRRERTGDPGGKVYSGERGLLDRGGRGSDSSALTGLLSPEATN